MIHRAFHPSRARRRESMDVSPRERVGGARISLTFWRRLGEGGRVEGPCARARVKGSR